MSPLRVVSVDGTAVEIPAAACKNSELLAGLLETRDQAADATTPVPLTHPSCTAATLRVIVAMLGANLHAHSIANTHVLLRVIGAADFLSADAVLHASVQEFAQRLAERHSANIDALKLELEKYK